MYYYFGLIFILQTTLGRPCPLTLELLVYGNGDPYLPPPPILEQLSTSLWQTFMDHHYVQNSQDRPGKCGHASSSSERVLLVDNANLQASPMTVNFPTILWLT